MNTLKTKIKGFTLIEILVVIAIVGILSSIVIASMSQARMKSRDKTRISDLAQIQLALKLYQVQNGRYPESGANCPVDNWCTAGEAGGGNGFTSSDEEFIADIAPNFIPVLPRDPKNEDQRNRGYYYRTNAEGTAYKVLSYRSIESDVVDANHEYARCPASAACVTDGCVVNGIFNQTYGVYTPGAECW